MTGSEQQAIPKLRPRIQPKAAKLALYGGGFDPVHNAHIKIARAALAHLKEGELCFIPAAFSPLKDEGPIASETARIAMLELALKAEPEFLLDDLEIRRGGRSFTVDTVAAFRHSYPGVELFWVIGADQFTQLDRWTEIDRLKEMLTFLVVGRPGFSLGSTAVSELRFEVVEVPLMNESSSEVRERCRAGRSIRDLVPDQVEAFISKHGLYSS